MTNIALTIDALTARVRFGELLDKVTKKQKRFLIARRGKPEVVVLSVEDYLKNIVKKSNLLTKVQASASQFGLDKISTKDIDEEISSFRKSKR